LCSAADPFAAAIHLLQEVDMRYWLILVAGAALIACSGEPPTGALAEVQFRQGTSERMPPLVMNTQLRSELEVPACESESMGHAHIKVLQDDVIESRVRINNKGGEVVRFGHIHYLNPGEPTGPVIWWLTSPVGTNLALTARQLSFEEEAIFVGNPYFDTHAEAVAELRSNPSAFYVNFHSNACPGGFVRGPLP
jgi:hypothetical protein